MWGYGGERVPPLFGVRGPVPPLFIHAWHNFWQKVVNLLHKLSKTLQTTILVSEYGWKCTILHRKFSFQKFQFQKFSQTCSAHGACRICTIFVPPPFSDERNAPACNSLNLKNWITRSQRFLCRNIRYSFSQYMALRFRSRGWPGDVWTSAYIEMAAAALMSHDRLSATLMNSCALLAVMACGMKRSSVTNWKT